jgi:PAS domain S-box-containing protein
MTPSSPAPLGAVETDVPEWMAAGQSGIGTAEVGVLVLGPAGQVVDANAAAAALLAGPAGGELRRALRTHHHLADGRVSVPVTTRLDTAAGAALTITVLPEAGGTLLAVLRSEAPPVDRPLPAWVDHMPGLLALIDEQRRVISANGRLRAGLGRTIEELRGRPLAELLPPADAERVEQYLATLPEERAAGRSPSLEVHLLDRDGEPLEVDLTAAHVPGEGPQAPGWCLVFHEIAARKASEREMEAYTHDLETLYLKLEQRSEQLEQAYEDLRQARVETLRAEELARLEQMKSAFLDVAAHELRTPVTLLMGLLDCLRSVPPGQLYDYMLENAGRSAQRLADILNTALKLLASDKPDFTGQFKVASLAKVLEAAVSDVRSLAEQRCQEIVLECEPDLPRLVMDRSMVRDIVVNLLMNAIKFTPDGGRVTVTAGADSEHCWFAVRDTGVGICDVDRPYIFESFFGTMDTSHHSSGHFEFNTRGPGFGLAVVKKFVEHHGGRVECESHPGKGACFTIRLPRRSAHAAAHAHGK